MVRHFTSDLDISASEQKVILDRADAMKKRPKDFNNALQGKILGMIFVKSSTRTRVSFEAGIVQLGGHGMFLQSSQMQIGRGEPISDTGQVLSRYLDLLMIRTFGHDEVTGLAASSTIPVINGLDDLLHPCQALADLLTMRQHRGDLKGQQLVFVGDGNNVAHSLMYAGALAGVHVRVVTPKGYEPSNEVLKTAQKVAKQSGATIETTNDLDAVADADAVYTDVWASMGQETEAKKRQKAFAKFQVTSRMMKAAKKDALFLHCLPAHRGEEVAADVIDGKWSVVFDQAENRLHAQKALMTFLMNG